MVMLVMSSDGTGGTDDDSGDDDDSGSVMMKITWSLARFKRMPLFFRPDISKIVGQLIRSLSVALAIPGSHCL
jgi:hypothetical protein